MSLKPISVDLEMSGLDPVKNGIWQIGAVDLNTMEEFLEESRIDDEDSVEEDALKVIGKTEEELRDHNKQSQKEMLQKFFEWVSTRKLRTLLCHNPQSDIGFLWSKSNKYGLKRTFQHRAFDTHTIAQMRFFDINDEFLVRSGRDTNGKESDMNLPKVLELCGLKDERREVINGEVVKEGNPHNALEDSKLTAECFSRLIYGKSIFSEYSKFPVPVSLEVKEK